MIEADHGAQSHKSEILDDNGKNESINGYDCKVHANNANNVVYNQDLDGT